MFTRILFAALAAAGTLASASAAQAAYLTLGTSNISDASTTLTGNTAGAELLVKNANGSSASAFSLYGLLTATAPTVNAAAVRGYNSATNGLGYGVYGSHAGSGAGVYGKSPKGRGVWGHSPTGTGVRGSSSKGIGVFGSHSAETGTGSGVRGESGSTASGAYAIYGLLSSPQAGFGSVAIRGENKGNVSTGVGVYGSQAGFGYGVEGFTPWGRGVYGVSTSGTGVYGSSAGSYGVRGTSPFTGVWGQHTSFSGTSAAVYGTTNSTSNNAIAVEGMIGPGSGQGAAGIHGVNNGGWLESIGVRGDSSAGTGVCGTSSSGYGVAGKSSTGYAGFFDGKLLVTNGCFGCGGASLKIDYPLDPAHKYLQHSSVASSQQLDIYSGNVVTNAKGFATVAMPRWFQALNRNFRYQLTSLSGLQEVAVAKEIAHNRFTIQSEKPHAKVSWQVTGIRHDRFANANRIKVVLPKAKAEQGKYLHPELYGQPKSEGIGYQKPLRRPPRRSSTR